MRLAAGALPDVVRDTNVGVNTVVLDDADLVLLDRRGEIKLRIPNPLMAQVRAMFRPVDPLYAELGRMSRVAAPQRLETRDVETLAVQLGASCARNAQVEEGALVWITPELTGALMRKAPADLSTEACDEESALINSAAVLALALRRGLMIMHVRDRWALWPRHLSNEGRDGFAGVE